MSDISKAQAVRETPRLDMLVNELQEHVARTDSASNHLRTMVERLGGSWRDPDTKEGEENKQQDSTLNNLTATIADLSLQISHIEESLQNLGQLV